MDNSKVQHRVRLASIVAPEKGQAFGNASKENLSRPIFDRHVESRCHKRDRYGREVCAIFAGVRDVGLEQARAGMAWWYREYAHEQTQADLADYESAEVRARSGKVGLWSGPNPIPPWEWRRK